MENLDKEILKQLSSQKGDKTEIANRLVAENCIANPKILICNYVFKNECNE